MIFPTGKDTVDFMGEVAGEIARRAKKASTPVIKKQTEIAAKSAIESISYLVIGGIITIVIVIAISIALAL